MSSKQQINNSILHTSQLHTTHYALHTRAAKQPDRRIIHHFGYIFGYIFKNRDSPGTASPTISLRFAGNAGCGLDIPRKFLRNFARRDVEDDIPYIRDP